MSIAAARALSAERQAGCSNSPQGSQITELGLIPNDWQVLPLGAICRLINGRGFKPFEWKTSGRPIIRIQNLNGSDDFNFYDGPYAKKLEIAPGQLLFAWSGSRGTSFGPHFWNGPLGLLNYHTWKVEVDNKVATAHFLFHKLKELTSEIEGWAHGASALVHVQKWQMEKFRLAIPTSKTEQHAIAEALSDADALIASLDALIAKKRDIKQAAMQQLLTGNTRLPGFKRNDAAIQRTSIGNVPSDWAISTIGEEFCVQLGKMLDAAKNTGILKPYLGNRSVQWGRIETDGLQMMAMTPADLNRFRLRKGDLLVCEGGEVGRAAIWEGQVDECYYQKALHRLRPRKDYDTRLLVALLQLWSKGGLFSNFVTQTSIAHLPKEKLILIPLLRPSPAEQAAIATVLLDMDAELTALEAQRDKAHAIKQGMMQELLTGRIRLV